MVLRVACKYGLMMEYKTDMGVLTLQQEFAPTPENSDYISDPVWVIVTDGQFGPFQSTHYIKREDIIAWSMLPETQVVPATVNIVR